MVIPPALSSPVCVGALAESGSSSSCLMAWSSCPAASSRCITPMADANDVDVWGSACGGGEPSERVARAFRAAEALCNVCGLHHHRKRTHASARRHSTHARRSDARRPARRLAGVAHPPLALARGRQAAVLQRALHLARRGAVAAAVAAGRAAARVAAAAVAAAPAARRGVGNRDRCRTLGRNGQREQARGRVLTLPIPHERRPRDE